MKEEIIARCKIDAKICWFLDEFGEIIGLSFRKYNDEYDDYEFADVNEET